MKTLLAMTLAGFAMTLAAPAFAQSDAGPTATPQGVAVIKETDRTKYRTYVKENAVPNYVFDGQVRKGITLPDRGITYRNFPNDYGVAHQYAVVNDVIVLVDPASRRIVDILN